MHATWMRIGVTLIGVWALSASALATPFPGAAIESSLARFLLSETDDGIALMSRYLGRTASASDFDDFLRSVREAAPGRDHVRHDLEARISRLREELHRARVARNGGRNTAESERFSPEEQLVLREAAKQEFSLAQDARPMDPQVGESRFAKRERLGFKASREEFLHPLTPEEDSLLRIKPEPLEKAPKRIQKEAKKGFAEWASDAESCLKNRPDNIAKSAEKRDLIQQLAITAGVNSATYFTNLAIKSDFSFETGISEFDVGGFSVDMLISLTSTAVGMSWMKNKDTFHARWIKVYSWGQGRTVLDAELYQINPWTDTHGKPMDEAVSERRTFNASWSAQTSIISPVMFTILSGAECLIGEAKGAAAAERFGNRAFWVKLGISAGMSYLYYRVRSDQLNSTSGAQR